MRQPPAVRSHNKWLKNQLGQTPEDHAGKIAVVARKKKKKKIKTDHLFRKNGGGHTQQRLVAHNNELTKHL